MQVRLEGSGAGGGEALIEQGKLHDCLPPDRRVRLPSG